MRTLILFCLPLAALAGCGDVNELQDADSNYVRTADYPDLVPLETLGLAPEDDESIDETARLKARANALRNRAQRLKGDVINDADLQRLEQGVVEG